jgi:hypothetical protein
LALARFFFIFLGDYTMAIKIDGQTIPKMANEDVLVLPRGNKTIVIRARAIPDMDHFNEVCPAPKPPGGLTKDGFVPNLKDDTYTKRLEQHNLQRIGYMVVKSIEPSKIEWERVSLDNPKTWLEWEEELKESGFTTMEQNLILGLVMEVNNLNEAKLNEARASFLRGQEQEQSDSASQSSEQSDSPSGEPVTG